MSGPRRRVPAERSRIDSSTTPDLRYYRPASRETDNDDHKVTIDQGAHDAVRPPPRPVYLYLNSAAGKDAAARIDNELGRFRAHDYHRRHQRAMAATSTVGAAVRTPEDVPAALEPYESLALPVISAVRPTSEAERRTLMETFAPLRH
ncbi:hypothetical protein [Phytohabitans kaempferiae]|uniref:Uncharacterized protein n=1 Tax=Phytohabitans kaempferiae TaxID=1620943 RepID=A0ABV6M762_9ACTN